MTNINIYNTRKQNKPNECMNGMNVNLNGLIGRFSIGLKNTRKEYRRRRCDADDAFVWLSNMARLDF